MLKSITYDDTLYQLVPKEPTDEMVEAAWESDGTDYVGEHKRIWQFSPAYKAALSAAPTPPAQPEAVRVPLTDELIDKFAREVGGGWRGFARAIEAAHGITAAEPKQEPKD